MSNQNIGPTTMVSPTIPNNKFNTNLELRRFAKQMHLPKVYASFGIKGLFVVLLFIYVNKLGIQMCLRIITLEK